MQLHERHSCIYLSKEARGRSFCSQTRVRLNIAWVFNLC